MVSSLPSHSLPHPSFAPHGPSWPPQCPSSRHHHQQMPRCARYQTLYLPNLDRHLPHPHRHLNELDPTEDDLPLAIKRRVCYVSSCLLFRCVSSQLLTSTCPIPLQRYSGIRLRCPFASIPLLALGFFSLYSVSVYLSIYLSIGLSLTETPSMVLSSDLQTQPHRSAAHRYCDGTGQTDEPGLHDFLKSSRQVQPS